MKLVQFLAIATAMVGAASWAAAGILALWGESGSDLDKVAGSVFIGGTFVLLAGILAVAFAFGPEHSSRGYSQFEPYPDKPKKGGSGQPMPDKPAHPLERR